MNDGVRRIIAVTITRSSCSTAASAALGRGRVAVAVVLVVVGIVIIVVIVVVGALGTVWAAGTLSLASTAPTPTLAWYARLVAIITGVVAIRGIGRFIIGIVAVILAVVRLAAAGLGRERWHIGWWLKERSGSRRAGFC